MFRVISFQTGSGRGFEPFILQKKEADKAELEKQAGSTSALQPEVILPAVSVPRHAEPEVEEAPPPEPAPAPKHHNGIQLRTANLFFMILALIAAVALFIADFSVTNGFRRMERASDRYISAQMAASDMESGSDYLTDRVRCFVVTGILNT